MHQNPSLFKDSRDVIQLLDSGCMSSDDSEVEAYGDGVTVETVRRRKLPWRSDTLTLLLHSVDSYASNNEPRKRGRGSNHRKLNHFNSSTSTACKPVKGLPRNFYNDSSLGPLKTRTFAVIPSAPIPALVRNFHYEVFSS